MFFGTIAGLMVKYVLDRNFIFYYSSTNKKNNTNKFLLYSLTGAFTTVIFWSVEILFYYLIPNPNAKYIGAVTGLSIGYSIKYFLDKKYVFI